MILGKSGVGKSSLLNYLFEDENMAKTGSGAPVTEQGFHLKPGNINGKNLNIYDSSGLEPGNTNIWLEQFEDFIKHKRVEKDIKKWIHTVIFCISAEGKRIEPFEKEVLKFLKNEKLNSIIVITKADSDKEGVFKNEVLRITGIEPIEVCSVEKIKGLGNNKNVTKGYGRDEIIQNILTNSIESFKERFNYIQNNILLERAQSGESKIMEYVKKEIKSLSSGSIFNNISESDAKKILNKVDSKLQSYDTDTKIIIDRLLMDAEDFLRNKILLVYNNFITINTSLSKKTEPVILKSEPAILEKMLITIFWIPLVIIGIGLELYDESKVKFEARVHVFVKKHFEKSYLHV